MAFLGFGGNNTDTALKERTDERTREVPLEEGDHDRFSHYVKAEDLTEAMVMGYPMVALCGKVWVPSRDGLKFPICPQCKEMYEGLPNDSDGNE